MNFKRYHVSRNLWDFGQWLIDRGATYTKDGDSYTFESQQALYSTPFYFSQTDITVSISGLIEAVTATNPRLHLLKADGTRARTDALTTAVSKRENVSCAGLIFDWSTPGNIKVSLPMLNEGDTALPYEPYSSEVWHDIPHYIHNTSTDTITTLPAVLYPNGTTATVGLKGQTTQSSTPSPTSPVMPQGTGERTAQLIDYTQSETGGIDGSGNYVLANNLWRSTAYTPIDETLQYFVSWTVNINLNVVRINYYTSDKTHISREQINTSGTALTIPQNAAYLKWTLYAKTDVIIDLSFVQSLQLMINTGSTVLPYEPWGVKIPISSASTTTPVYLGEVETTRKIKKYEFTGEETSYMAIDASKNIFSIRGVFNQVPGLLQVGGFCTHYKYNNAISSLSQNMSNGDFVLNKVVDDYSFTIRDNSFSNDTDFKQYVQQQYAAGTPVTVWYVLAEPTTGIVNEPLMKIGDYADEVSGISIPTIAGANTISVDTTLQPSEVTVNYKGWHPVADVHERENGAWT